jgi:colicin import membrane protein
MRLGTLAKELDIKFPVLEEELIAEFKIVNDKGPNFKLEEDHINYLKRLHPLPEIIEEPIEETVIKEDKVEATIEIPENIEETEDEVEVEIYEVEAKKEVPEKIDLDQFETKPAPVTKSNTTEDINYEPKDEEEKEAIEELEARIDEKGVIRAPKAEPLKGIKVLDKIELPRELTAEEKEEKRIAKLKEKGLIDENGEEIQVYKPQQKTKEEREAERQKRKERKLQRELKAREQKKKREEAYQKKQAEEKAKKEKAARKQHYLDQVSKKKEQIEQGTVKVKKKGPAKKSQKKKEVEYKPSTGFLGWFWRLLDPK